jgi:hypothetical protein
MPRVTRERAATLLTLLLLRGYEAWLGADIPYHYFVEPRPVLWEPDPELGFRNRANLTHRIFGGLVCHTNAVGFRGRRDFSPARIHGTPRIFGVGDSVMWGCGLNQADSFLAILQRLLAEDLPDLEVINAGVVGYSTYQERLLFERGILPYAPDLVLVNFCPNDYLPTEDPFGNVREIYARYLRSLDAPEAPVVEALSSVLRSPNSWAALKRVTRDPRMQGSLRELLIDRPIIEMAHLARERKIRLVYLLIPLTFESAQDRALRLQLGRMLSENGIEYIDFSDALREERELHQRERRFEEGLAHRILRGSGLSGLLRTVSLDALDPIPPLRNISRLRGAEEAHQRRNYIDRIGHPSRRGSRIIAEEIHRYLSAHPLFEGARESGRRSRIPRL